MRAKELKFFKKRKEKALTFSLKTGIIKKLKDAPQQKRREEMQVSPSGMAAASQAAPGEFDSRHLLQKDKRPLWGVFLFGTANAVENIRLSHAKLFFAFGHAHAYLSAFAYLAPKKHYQCFS